MRTFWGLVGGLFLAAGVAAPAAPAVAQGYGYVSTIGDDGGAAGLDNGHFNQPFGVAIDPASGHLFVSDSVNERIQVFNTSNFAYVATIGPDDGSKGTDNGHFDLPGGITVDTVHGHLLVPDLDNNRVQVFSTSSFAYVGTLGSDSGVAGTDNAHFYGPSSVTFDKVNDQLLVTDIGNHRIQVFNAATLGYATTVSATGAHRLAVTAPVGIGIDPTHGRIFIDDYSGECVEIMSAGSFAADGTVGDACTGTASLANGGYHQPFGAGYDSTHNRVLIADTYNNRVQIFDGSSYGYIGTIGSDLGGIGTSNAALFEPSGVTFDAATGNVIVADTLNNRVQVFNANVAAASPLVAAVLPGSRAVAVGSPATVFAAAVNASGATLGGCGVALPSDAPAGLTMTYQTTDAQNQVTGPPNTPTTILPQGGQAYVLTFQSSVAESVRGLPLVFDCSGVPPAASIPGVNTIDLSFSTTPGADIIALASTATSNGIVELPAGGTSAFAVATVNLGAAEMLTVSVDSGGATLLASAEICETDPSTGACLGPASVAYQRSFIAGEAPTFSIFVGAGGTIPFDPANSRIFVRFTDSSGAPHGSTSVAVTTE
jgi:DNA-binding beta-propeller fold protein YncE